MKLVVRNIGQLFLADFTRPPGVNRCRVETLDDAYVSVENGKIAAYGREEEFSAPEGAETIDARGGCVVPGLVDCHTHTVYAGTRENEFVERIQGKTYAQIAREGGGIWATVEAVRNSGLDELVELALPRLRRMLSRGVTTVEIKSGYGLSVDDELKMLQAVKRLGELQPVELVGTYLGAHAIPREYAARRSSYVDLVTSSELMGRVAREGLAEFCDVFTETTAFTVAESRRVLLAAKEYGLMPKLHADQITQMGASRLAAEVGAISADHLETIDESGVAALKEAGVIAVLLPGCSFFLGVEPAPARALLEAGLPVALATDMNPGSSMLESLPLVMSIACTQMRLTPAEALVAATANAAAALNREHRIGRIKEGMQADLIVLDVPNYEQWAYHVGRNCVHTVIKEGRVCHRRRDESDP